MPGDEGPDVLKPELLTLGAQLPINRFREVTNVVTGVDSLQDSARHPPGRPL